MYANSIKFFKKYAQTGSPMSLTFWKAMTEKCRAEKFLRLFVAFSLLHSEYYFDAPNPIFLPSIFLTLFPSLTKA
jgi:hypothetical protein